MQPSYLDQQRTVKKGIRPLTSSNVSRLSKLNMDKNLQKQKLTISFNNNQINEQLQLQIKAISQCIYNYQQELKQIDKKNKLKGIREEIFSIEEIIKKKDELIKIINQQIIQLKTNASQTYKEQYANSHFQSNNPKFKLAQELKFQGQQLQHFQTQHKQKLSRLNKIKKAVNLAEDKFIDHCQKTRQRPIRYEQFKQLNEERKKQIQSRSKKQQQTQIKKYSSIKQFQNKTQNIHQQKQNSNKNTKKSMKGLQDKKVVAEQALKNLRKKHNHQTSQLTAKIQFLRDQDNLLLQTIRQKQQQMHSLQAKFNQTRGNYRGLGKLGLSDKRQNIMKRHYDSGNNSQRKNAFNMKSSRKNNNQFYQYGF